MPRRRYAVGSVLGSHSYHKGVQSRQTMDDLAATQGRKAEPALGMTQRLHEVLEGCLRYHRIEGSTAATST